MRQDANGRERAAKDANWGATAEAAEANASGRWVTTEEAGRLLGVNTRTVQKQAAAGRLRSRQEGRRVLVWIDAEQDGQAIPETAETAPQSPQDASGARIRAQVREQGADKGRDTSGPLVEALQSENAFLRQQLEARTTAEAEFRRLLAHAQETARRDREQIEELRQRLAITAAAPAPPAGSEQTEGRDGGPVKTPAEPGRAWWQFWRRRERGQG